MKSELKALTKLKTDLKVKESKAYKVWAKYDDALNKINDAIDSEKELANAESQLTLANNNHEKARRALLEAKKSSKVDLDRYYARTNAADYMFHKTKDIVEEKIKTYNEVSKNAEKSLAIVGKFSK